MRGVPEARVRRAVPLVLLLVGVAVAVALTGPAPGDAPLDPRSTSALGTKALVDSLAELGVDVDVVREVPADADVALLLADRLSEEGVEQARGWVRDGGTLVVADPTSSLSPVPVGTVAVAGFGEAPLSPDCGLTAIEHVARVLPSAGSGLYEAPPGSVACFPRGEGHWLAAEEVGSGVIVSLGGPEVFVNARLAEPAHPELAAGLLGGGGRVVFIEPQARAGEAAGTLLDLIGANVWLLLAQLALAFCVYAAWRARRLGPPVAEPQPVTIPASELVAAVGNLLQETRARQRAAEIVRADLRRTLTRRLGVPVEAPLDDAVAVVASRTGEDPTAIARVLAGPTPRDEEALVELCQAAERLRGRALRLPGPGTADRGFYDDPPDQPAGSPAMTRRST